MARRDGGNAIRELGQSSRISISIKISGCGVPSYCVMSNHFHILLEVPPVPKGGLGDVELLKRLGVFYYALD